MAEGFNEFEMEDLNRMYPKYDNYNEQELNDEYDSLSKRHLEILRNFKLEEDSERMNDIERLQENKRNNLH